MTKEWLVREIRTPTGLRYVAVTFGSIGVFCDLLDAAALASDHRVSAWAGWLSPLLFLAGVLALWLLRPQRPHGYAQLLTGLTGALWIVILFWSLPNFQT